MIADLDNRLLTPLIMLGSAVANRVRVSKKSNFDLVSQDFVLFLTDLGYLLVNNGEDFKQSVLNLQFCSTKG